MPLENQSVQVKQAYHAIYRVAFNHCSSSATACEDFLFAWYNEHAWGRWAPQSIASLDRLNGQHLLTLLASIHAAAWYPPSADMSALAERKGRKRLSVEERELIRRRDEDRS